jgi:hypothetical protein
LPGALSPGIIDAMNWQEARDHATHWIHRCRQAITPAHIRRGALGLIVGLLALASFGAWRGPIVVVGPRQQVVTHNPKIGVHTRLTDEVEEWKIKRTLEMVREMGAPWIVEYFPWAYYEPERGRFAWAHADMVVDHAVAQGLTVIARLGYTPAWARPKAAGFLYLDEAHYADFANYAYAFVEHFKGRIQYIIIWNEPNLRHEWGDRDVDPAGYVEMLRQCYLMAKRADPTVQVLAGALAPTLAPEGSADGMDDLIYLRRMYEAGAADAFDILAVHAYGWSFPVDTPPDPTMVDFRRAELQRQLMVEFGDAEKPVMITEGGWNDHPRWSKRVGPAERVAYSVAAYDMAWREWDWCQAVALWAFRFPRPANTYQDYFTFAASDFYPKAIYLEVQRYAQTGQP